VLGHLNLVLREQRPAVGDEQVAVGEIDVPLVTIARRRLVAEDVFAQLVSERTVGHAVGEGHRRPAGDLDRPAVAGAGWAGETVDEALVRIGDPRRMRRDELVGVVRAAGEQGRGAHRGTSLVKSVFPSADIISPRNPSVPISP
jgi:hypothetical protein